MSKEPESAAGAPVARGEFSVHIERVVLDPHQPPKALHKAMHTGVDNDMLLELGYFDLREAYDMIELAKKGELPADPQVVRFFITDRFVITPQAAADLFLIAQRMVEFFQQKDMLPADLSKRPGFLRTKETD